MISWVGFSAGEPEAQNGLAERYRNGDGLPKNAEEAEQWYRKAAEKGSADAQSTLLFA